jgi:hypothetical protein
MSCHESDHGSVISDDIIDCELFEGDNTASPPIPTFILIPITKAISSGTNIKLTVLNILNPTEISYPIGITIKMMDKCDNADQNNLCTYYKSTDYIEFSTASSIPGLGTTGSLSFSPNRVSAINAAHTVSASYTVNSGDYVKIVYYPEVIVPDICSITSGNGICYSYPLENTILIKATSTQTSSYSFTLGGMTNLYQRYSSNIQTEVWDAVTGTIRSRFTTSYLVNHIQTDPNSGDALEISFTTTLTPDYQLKYSFNNIARIEITHLLQNTNIRMIYITGPSEVTFSSSYCNATLESTTAEATPYPYRY